MACFDLKNLLSAKFILSWIFKIRYPCLLSIIINNCKVFHSVAMCCRIFPLYWTRHLISHLAFNAYNRVHIKYHIHNKCNKIQQQHIPIRIVCLVIYTNLLITTTSIKEDLDSTSDFINFVVLHFIFNVQNQHVNVWTQ